MRSAREKKLQVLAAKILKELGVRAAALDVVLLTDAEMKRMKWHRLGKKTEPNVLSFPEPERFPHPETKRRHLGEVYLNQDILKKSPERAAPLLVHGMLHLLGYDHVKNAAVRMERLEEKILSALAR